MASAGQGDFPLTNDRVNRQAMTETTPFGLQDSASADVQSNYFFGDNNIRDAVMSGDGIATAIAVSSPLVGADMNGAGVATAIAVGSALADAVMNAIGVATAEAVGATDSFSDAVMSAAGLATAEAVGSALADAVMNAAGVATAIAVGTGSAPGDVVPIWRDSDFAEPGTQTHSFTGVDIGTAAADRLTFVVVGLNADLTANEGVLSINGTPATREVSRRSTSLEVLAEIWWAATPTGTTATISYDAGSGKTIDAIWISTYEITEASIIDPVSDTDSAHQDADAATITLDIGAGGGLIAGTLSGLDATGGDSVSWSGATEDLDREDLTGGILYSVFSSASDSTAAELLAHDVTATHTGADFIPHTVLAGVALRSVNTVFNSDGVASSAGSATAVANGEGVIDAAMSAAGAATAAAVGEAVSLADGEMNGAGSATAVAEGASLADAAISADGSATAIAEGEGGIVIVVPDFTPVGGGGAIPPVRDRDKRFRIRKDKTQPHVIRVGDWPTEAQLRELADALEREERRDFAQFISGLEEPEQAEVYDEEEQALMLILAAA